MACVNAPLLYSQENIIFYNLGKFFFCSFIDKFETLEEIFSFLYLAFELKVVEKRKQSHFFSFYAKLSFFYVENKNSKTFSFSNFFVCWTPDYANCWYISEWLLLYLEMDKVKININQNQVLCHMNTLHIPFQSYRKIMFLRCLCFEILKRYF